MQAHAIGARGAVTIQEILVRSGPNAVAEIQQQYGLHVPNTTPALQFLNLFGVSRLQCHQSVLQLLVSRLVVLVEASPTEKLSSLLPGCIDCLAVEELKRIPLAILLKLQPNLPPAILSRLAADPDTLSKLPLVLQRLVWEVSPALYQAKFNSVVRAEKDDVIRELVTLIGESEKIYSMTLGFFRSSFTKDGNPNWCTLRMSLLMTLHSMNWPHLDTRDSCHQFAWFLATGTREAKFEERLIEKLRHFVTSVPDGSPIFGDMAMIAASPSVKKALLDSIMSGVTDVVKVQAIPVEHANLSFLAQLLLMGLTARRILKQQNFSVPRMPDEVIRGFFPLLCADALAGEMEDDEPLHPSISQYFNFQVCREVMHFYVLQNLSMQQTGPLTRLCACVLPIESYVLMQRPDFIEFVCQAAQGLSSLKMGLEQCANLQVVLNLMVSLAAVSANVHVAAVQLIQAASSPMTPLLATFLETLWQKGLVNDTGVSEFLRSAYAKLGKSVPTEKITPNTHQDS